MKIHNILRSLVAAVSLSISSISFADGQSLELVGSCELTGSPEHIVVDDNYAYIGGPNPLIQIIDVSDPHNPDVIGSYDTTGATWDLCVAKSHVFIAGHAALFIVNVTDPANPVLVGVYDNPRIAHDVDVKNEIAYLVECHRIFALDVSDLSNPLLLGDTIIYLGDADRLSLKGSYAFVVDRIYEPTTTVMTVLNIDDPSHPMIVNRFTDLCFGNDIAIMQDYAYIPYDLGLQIVNIAEPSNPYLAAVYDSISFAREINIDDNYVFLAENDWSGEGGIRILNISNPINPQLLLFYDDYPYMDIYYRDGLLYAVRAWRILDIFRFSTPTNIEVKNNGPAQQQILDSYPNPFNASTTIKYSLQKARQVRIDIYDLLGRRIETLVDEEKQAGQHQVIWDASNHSSGVYFYRIEAGDLTETRKMILLK